MPHHKRPRRRLEVTFDWLQPDSGHSAPLHRAMPRSSLVLLALLVVAAADPATPEKAAAADAAVAKDTVLNKNGASKQLESPSLEALPQPPPIEADNNDDLNREALRIHGRSMKQLVDNGWKPGEGPHGRQLVCPTCHLHYPWGGHTHYPSGLPHMHFTQEDFPPPHSHTPHSHSPHTHRKSAAMQNPRPPLFLRFY